MADQPLIDAADPRIQDIYANDVFVEIGESEISLLFSHDFYANGSKTAKPSVRIILSHDSYMRMVEFWEKRAKLLRRVYMNRTPNLYAGDPEETRKAFAELYPPSDDIATEKNP
jgi:hypothetical protein